MFGLALAAGIAGVMGLFLGAPKPIDVSFIKALEGKNESKAKQIWAKCASVNSEIMWNDREADVFFTLEQDLKYGDNDLFRFVVGLDLVGLGGRSILHMDIMRHRNLIEDPGFYEEFTAKLLDAGADINAQDQHGDTPLMLASLRGYSEMTKLLKRCGADESKVNKGGKTAKQIAEAVAVSRKSGEAAHSASITAELQRPRSDSRRIAIPKMPNQPQTLDADAVLVRYTTCPMTKEIMRDPVMASNGVLYEREAIERWFANGMKVDPLTGESMKSQRLHSSAILRGMIADWKGAGYVEGEVSDFVISRRIFECKNALGLIKPEDHGMKKGLFGRGTTPPTEGGSSSRQQPDQ